MPLNGSGAYSVPNIFLPSTTILSALVNSNFSDAGTALSTAVYKDGQQTLTANIPFASFKITGLGAGTARTDSINLGQVEDGTVGWVVAGGTSDAITATYSPAITALVDGQRCAFRATAANTTSTPTFIPNGVGSPLNITKRGGGVLVPGDIPGNLAETILRYNLANTRWELLNPAAPAVIKGSVKSNLVIKVASNTTVTVTASSATVSDGTNGFDVAVSATCNLGSAGSVNQLDTGTIAIDTWYYIWAISNGVTTGTLASTSSTAPTMPSGYTFKCYLGAVQTVHATAQLYGTYQFGRKATYIVGLAQTANIPIMLSGSSTGNVNTPTWTAVATGRFAPPTASQIDVIGQIPSNQSALSDFFMVAPNNSYGAIGSTTNPPPMSYTSGNDNNGVVVRRGISLRQMMTLESTNIYAASSIGSGTTLQLMAAGWEDNI